MRVAIFGATGRTGRLLLEESKGRGWDVSVLVRDPAKLHSTEEISIVIGDARSLPEVSRTVEGADAVFCCLAMSDTTVPATDLSDCVKTIIRAMPKKGVKRFIGIASAGELDHPDGGYRNKEGLPEFLQYVTADQIRCYEALLDSGLEWTLMCPGWLEEGIPVGRGKYAFEDLPEGSMETGYADLARTMADLVEEQESFRKRVGIVSFR